MFTLVMEFCGNFIKPEYIHMYRVKDLVSLEITKKEIQLSDSDLGVGKYIRPILSKCLKNKEKKLHTVNLFFLALREGYLEIAKALMELSPLNRTITELSYLSPALFFNEHLQSSLKSLAARLPNVVNPSEPDCLDMELKWNQLDTTLDELNINEEDSNLRLDTDCWCHVFNRRTDEHEISNFV
nr:translation initiation factor IF-2 [Biomphalaria glabrata]